jgi:hypothetical protein
MIDEIKVFRDKYPDYNDMDDATLAQNLASKYPDAYGDLPNKVKSESPPAQNISKEGAGIPLAFAGGVNKGIAGLLGMPVDLMNTAIGGYGGEEPVGGSKWIGKFMPQSPKPQGMAENIVSGIGEQVPYAVPGVGMAAKGSNLLRVVGQAARPVIGGGTGAGIAREVAPDNPVAEMIATLLGSVSPAATQPIKEWLSPKGRTMIQSAMKPPTTVNDATLNKAIDAFIDNDISLSRKGLKQIGNLRGKLDSEIADTINSVVKNVDMKDVAKRVDDLKAFYSVLPPADAAKFLEPLDEIQRIYTSMGQIPGPQAQKLKQALYTLNKKHYGELKNATTEAYKNVARGLKEELVVNHPQLAKLNADDSALIELNKIITRSVHRIDNYDIVRLSDLIAGGTAAMASGGAGWEASAVSAASAFLAKRIIESPTVKAALGKALTKVGKKDISVPISRLFIGAGAVTNE